MIGQTINNYVIERKLGEGGMGGVYFARHNRIDRVVAIKILHEKLFTNESIRGRFKNEANALIKLGHPNIVKIYDYVEQEKLACLIMEYIDGATLDDYINKVSGPLPASKAMGIICNVLDAVQYAHENHIFHRDIKPGNIMVSKDGTNVKIMDFSIAKFSDGTGMKTTHAHAQLGTPFYMSPEQVKGMAFTALSDIYSLGVTLFEMVTGKCPYQEITNLYELQSKIVNEPLPPTSKYYQNVPAKIQEAIRIATNKAPEQRFQSCQEFKSHLLRADNAQLNNPVKQHKQTQLLPPDIKSEPPRQQPLRSNPESIIQPPSDAFQKSQQKKNSKWWPYLLVLMFVIVIVIIVFIRDGPDNLSPTPPTLEEVIADVNGKLSCNGVLSFPEDTINVHFYTIKIDDQKCEAVLEYNVESSAQKCIITAEYNLVENKYVYHEIKSCHCDSSVVPVLPTKEEIIKDLNGKLTCSGFTSFSSKISDTSFHTLTNNGQEYKVLINFINVNTKQNCRDTAYYENKQGKFAYQDNKCSCVGTMSPPPPPPPPPHEQVLQDIGNTIQYNGSIITIPQKMAPQNFNDKYNTGKQCAIDVIFKVVTTGQVCTINVVYNYTGNEWRYLNPTCTCTKTDTVPPKPPLTKEEVINDIKDLLPCKEITDLPSISQEFSFATTPPVQQILLAKLTSIKGSSLGKCIITARYRIEQNKYLYQPKSCTCNVTKDTMGANPSTLQVQKDLIQYLKKGKYPGFDPSKSNPDELITFNRGKNVVSDDGINLYTLVDFTARGQSYKCKIIYYRDNNVFKFSRINPL